MFTGYFTNTIIEQKNIAHTVFIKDTNYVTTNSTFSIKEWISSFFK